MLKKGQSPRKCLFDSKKNYWANNQSLPTQPYSVLGNATRKFVSGQSRSRDNIGICEGSDPCTKGNMVIDRPRSRWLAVYAWQVPSGTATVPCKTCLPRVSVAHLFQNDCKVAMCGTPEPYSDGRRSSCPPISLAAMCEHFGNMRCHFNVRSIITVE